MKILYVTTVGDMMKFFTKYIKELIDQGHTVDLAANTDGSPIKDCYSEWGCNIFKLSCTRSPFNIGTIKAISEIKKIVKDGGYDIVHCHSPIASVCTRLACKGLRKKGVKVIYTAHGFHFYKGAPLKNWLIYYTAEKLCARYTDVLITMNREDYELATRKFKKTRVVYVPGVGIDIKKFSEVKVDRGEKRRELGIPEDAYFVLSVGELNENKNHEAVIRAVAMLDKNVHYGIAGKGARDEYLVELAEKLGIKDRFHLFGYRNDIAEICKAADLYALPSYREGLNVSVMEALAAGLPVVCSDIRGNSDMIENGKNGYLADPFKPETFKDAIESARVAEFDCDASRFDGKIINETMAQIYEEVYNGR